MMHEINLVKNQNTKNFPVSINQALIEHQSKQSESKLKKHGKFRLIEKQMQSIENFKNQIQLIEKHIRSIETLKNRIF